MNSLNELTTGEAALVGAGLGTAITLGIIMSVILIIAGWRIFEKAGEKGWKIFIPIYDCYILFKICGLKKWFWPVICISVITGILMGANMPPYVEDGLGYHIDPAADLSQYPAFLIGSIISCITAIVVDATVCVKLAKAFGKGLGYTFGLIFLPNIFTLILGFGKAKYNAKNLEK